LITLVELFYYFVLSTLYGVFGLHLLRRKGILATKFLGLYFSFFAIRTFISYFTVDGRLILFPHVIKVISPIHFLTPALSFLFFFFMLYPKRSFKCWQWLHFLPFILHFIELIPFYLGPVEAKIHEAELIMQYKSLINYPSDVCYFSPRTLVLLKVFFTVGYGVLTAGMLIQFSWKAGRLVYQKNRLLLNWLAASVSIRLVSLYFTLSYVTGGISFNNLNFSYSDLLMNMDAMLNVAFLFVFPSLLDGVSLNSLVLRLNEPARQAEPGEDEVKLAKYQQIAERLELHFSKERVFLNPDLSQEMVASVLSVSPRELSRATVYMYNLSFPDFVNSWRIAYIVENQKVDETWRNYSQELLAEHSGFGSRQSLNNATNRLYQLTSARYFSAQLEK
jgi:AraC-like DNA-binding protein